MRTFGIVLLCCFFAELVCAPAIAQTSGPATEESKDTMLRARDRFKRGVELYKDGDYKLALIEFERAYALAPTYRILYNIGQVHHQLGHYAKGLSALERYLEEGGDKVGDERREAVVRDIAALRARTATLTVRVSQQGAEVFLDNEPLGSAPVVSMRVDAGRRVLRVKLRGFLDVERRLVLAGGDITALDVELRPLEPSGPLLPIAPKSAIRLEAAKPDGGGVGPEVWIPWAGAGALGVGAGVCAALAATARGDSADLKETPGTDAGERQAAANRAQSFGIAADALGVGAVVAAGFALYFTVTASDSPTQGRSRGPSLAVSPGSVRLRGEL